MDRVCAALGDGPGVVVLDNFETPWTADPLPVEALLRTIGAIAEAGVAVSARGTARPAGLRWRDFAMLSPLGLPEARRLFLAVAGAGFAADPGLDGLVAAVDGVPLAVELLGYAAQGEPDLAGVAQRWQLERVGVLERMGGGSRELSVAVSVEASFSSPLMTAAAGRLFGLLGLLPDGMAREDLPVLLPDQGLTAGAVLRRLGLVFDQGPRLRMLAPVREHAAAAHPPWPADLARASGHYAALAAADEQLGWGRGAQVAARLQAETGNMTVMLRHAASGERIDELVGGVSGLARYAQITGTAQPPPGLLAAAEQAVTEHGSTEQQARTWLVLGNLARDRSDYDQAQARYEQAAVLYRQAGDVLWEAHSVGGLADIALGRSDYDAARAWYQQTLALYRQAGDPRGQGNAIVRLSDIALGRCDYDTARAGYEQALTLYRQVRDDWGEDVLGQATSIRGLGDTARATADYDAAQARYEQALALYRQAGDVRGEARCITGLGDIARDRSDPDGARSWYEQALRLYQAIPDPYAAGGHWSASHGLTPRAANAPATGTPPARHGPASDERISSSRSAPNLSNSAMTTGRGIAGRPFRDPPARAGSKPGRDYIPTGFTGGPNWKPNWLPTTTATQPHSATLSHIIPGQPGHAPTSGNAQPSGENRLTVKQVYKKIRPRLLAPRHRWHTAIVGWVVRRSLGPDAVSRRRLRGRRRRAAAAASARSSRVGIRRWQATSGWPLGGARLGAG